MVSKSTTHFRNHYLNNHGIQIELNSKENRTIDAADAYKLLYAKLQGQHPDLDNQILKNAINAQASKKALLELILVQNLSFRLVETEEFQTFCYSLNPQAVGMLPSNHQTISNQAKEMFPSEKDIVRKVVQSAITQIHLSVDIWSSPNNHLLLATCAHFINIREQRFNILLALPTVSGHSGHHQWEALLPVLQDYGIVRKIGAIVGDNSGTNNVLC
jgi:hypothetical protein